MDQKTLKELLDYNSETGIFTWKTNRVQKKGIAGCLTNKGYISIKINNKKYTAHRLAWLYTYGIWPKDQIDHINGNKIDNRIINLREVTNRENALNRTIHRNGRLQGCYYNKRDKKWQAQIRIDGKKYNLGLFNTELDAHSVYMKALFKLFQD